MTFIPAAHFSTGVNIPPTRVVIHATAPGVGFPSASKPGRARSTANYFKNPPNPQVGSAHYVVDIAEEIQCVNENTVAWHAPPNPYSIGIEICAEASYSRAQWFSPLVYPALGLAASRTADICHRYNIPITRLSVASLRNGARGICGHVDVSNAFLQSTHTDPGPNFPWTEFLTLVANDFDSLTAEDDMTLADDFHAFEQEVRATNAKRDDVGYARDQILSALGFDPKLAPAEIAKIVAGRKQ